eukprot:CAMPEP_0185570708 /NCGR_PEP_ID=MMETSP0434-20130131/2927_1 /TAXON_ID=626734 ORGANISM="Favella taraikaensis, Strain Fe Narragansett Bay" /NCGR_SAMPLE_ID=MMETSP0434 /ASSEMBLY_ACC=CAM_ASM_000379 /LENGTH=74 /DNA_ID=CAMNT_0028185909 /DNA_START=189 /DNA_END=413 /DNA_ORIENTATION=-
MTRKSLKSLSCLDLLAQATIPKKIPEWNPKAVPLSNEEELRFFLKRRKERREEEIKMIEEEEEHRRQYTKELER